MGNTLTTVLCRSVEAVNSLLYTFLWDNKPDKVNRETVCMDNLKGGLRMINIYNFEKALKINCLKRKIVQTDAQWNNLFSLTYKSFDKLFTLGGEWFAHKNKIVDNMFWKCVIDYWRPFCKNQIPRTNCEILQSCISYNSLISETPFYYSTWYGQSILYVGDIVNSNGEIITLEEIRNTYHFNPNILHYHSVRQLISKFIKKYKQKQSFSFQRPCYPLCIKPFITSRQGCQAYYNIFNSKPKPSRPPTCKGKWECFVEADDKDETWTHIFKTCFKSVMDNQLIWFQYRILFGILPTRYFLYKIKQSDSSLCCFCKESPETIAHLFCQCPNVTQLWHNIEHWISNKVKIKLTLINSLKILGHCKMDRNYWPLNLVILVIKKYVYSCSKRGFQLNIFHLQNEVQNAFLEQRYVSEINSNQPVFPKRWELWVDLFS